jgi:hypothetical protein
LHSAHLFFTLPWRQGLHAEQLPFTLPCGQGVHFTQLLFRLPLGQGVHAVQWPFSLPWGQGLHSTQAPSNLPWGHGLHTVQSRFILPCGHRFPPILIARSSRRTPSAHCVPRTTSQDAKESGHFWPRWTSRVSPRNRASVDRFHLKLSSDFHSWCAHAARTRGVSRCLTAVVR